MGREHGVVLDPRRSYGKPMDSESGVPTDVLFHMVEAGESPEIVADWYQVKVRAVEAAVEFEQRLRAA
jgi:uncharacterized protein (DUF433 family)